MIELLLSWGISAAVKISIRPVIAVVVVVLLWAGFAYTVTRPDDAKAYLRTAMQAAESAHDSAVTGALTGRQQLAGQASRRSW
jgi:hypothetical protein